MFEKKHVVHKRDHQIPRIFWESLENLHQPNVDWSHGLEPNLVAQLANEEVVDWKHGQRSSFEVCLVDAALLNSD